MNLDGPDLSTPPDDRRRLLSPRELGLVLAVSAFLTVAHGLHYLVSNQVQYFLYGLRLADPAFAQNDWFTWETSHYHFAFGWLLWLLSKLGPLVVTTQFAQWLCLLAFSTGLYLLARRFCRHAVVVFLAVALWYGLAFPADKGLGQLYLISDVLQPSQVAGALFVLGLALLFERRFLGSGLALGAAGLFHVGILIAGAPVVLVQALACGVLKGRRRWLRFGASVVLLWGVVAALLIERMLGSQPGDGAALNVLIYFRASHHHVPATWGLLDILTWGVWVIGGTAAMLAAPRDAPHRALRLSLVAAFITCTAGLLFAVTAAIPALTAALLWRISAWALLLCLLCLLDVWVDLMLGERRIGRAEVFFVLAVLAAGVLWIVRSPTPRYVPARLAWLVAVPGAVMAAWVWRRLSRRQATRLVLAVLMAGVAFFGLTRATHLWADRSDAAALEEWVRANVPPGSVLVVPPDLGALRARTGRAVVVDWKCFPMAPAEIREWLRRICDLCGVPEAHVRSAIATRRLSSYTARTLLDRGYRRLDGSRARELGRRYGVRFVVVRADDHLGSLSGLDERYRNPSYVLLEVPPGGEQR